MTKTNTCIYVSFSEHLCMFEILSWHYCEALFSFFCKFSFGYFSLLTGLYCGIIFGMFWDGKYFSFLKIREWAYAAKHCLLGPFFITLYYGSFKNMCFKIYKKCIGITSYSEFYFVIVIFFLWKQSLSSIYCASEMNIHYIYKLAYGIKTSDILNIWIPISS